MLMHCDSDSNSDKSGHNEGIHMCSDTHLGCCNVNDISGRMYRVW